MAYNPQKDLNEIVYRKGRYVSGDDKTKKWASESAGQYYKNLMDNGYGYLADQYKNMEYDAAYSDYKTNYSPDKPQKSTSEAPKSTSQDYINSLRKNADTMLDAEYQKANEMYQREMDKTTQRYNDAKKDSYLDYRTQNQHINQQLGANGITGGAAESTIAANANNYLNGLTALDKEKNSAISDIEAEKRAAYYDQISKKAQNEIEFAREGRAAFESDRNFDETQKMNEHTRWMDGQTVDYNNNMLAETRTMNEHNRWVDGQEIDYKNKTLDEARTDREYNLAISAAESGNFGPLAKILGITEEQAKQNWKNMVAYEMSFNQGRSGGSRSRSGRSSRSRSSSGGDYIAVDTPVVKTNTALDEGRGPIAPPIDTSVPGPTSPGWSPWILKGNNPYDLNNAGKNLGFISE